MCYRYITTGSHDTHGVNELGHDTDRVQAARTAATRLQTDRRPMATGSERSFLPDLRGPESHALTPRRVEFILTAGGEKSARGS